VVVIKGCLGLVIGTMSSIDLISSIYMLSITLSRLGSSFSLVLPYVVVASSSSPPPPPSSFEQVHPF
jgi:hypothetical protein